MTNINRCMTICMSTCFILACHLVQLAAQPSNLRSTVEEEHHRYCVVGAGPAGLQLGHFLEKNKRDYVILERAAQRYVYM